MIKLLVDSSSDYMLDELENRDILFVPLDILLCGKTYSDGIDIKKDEFYSLLENTKEFPKTSMPSPEVFFSQFEKAKENGDSVICLLLSSELSGTYQSAVLAKKMVDYENIYIIDTRTVAASIKILTEYCLSLREQGLSAEEIVGKAENLKSRIKVYAVLDTLEYLYRGGRLSKTSATIGSVAKIKPTVTVENGAVAVIKKSLGLSKAKNELMNIVKSKNIDYDFPVYTLYTYGTDNCQKLEAELNSENIKFNARVQIGSTIGAHVGAGAFGVFFVEKE